MRKKNGTFKNLGLFLIVGDVLKYISLKDLGFALCHTILRDYLEFLLMINSTLSFSKWPVTEDDHS